MGPCLGCPATGGSSSGGGGTSSGGVALEWESLNLPRFIYGAVVLQSGTYLVETDQGLFRSSNQGLSWNQVPSAGELDGVTTLGAYAFGSCRAAGSAALCVSQDDGQTFVIRSPMEQGSPVTLHGYNVSPQGHIYLESYMDIWFSDDHGLTWSLLPGREHLPHAFDVADSNVQYRMPGNSEPQGIYRSEDQGVQWTVLTAGLTDLEGAVQTHPQAGHVYFVASGGDLMTSSNRGTSWTRVVTERPVHSRMVMGSSGGCAYFSVVTFGDHELSFGATCDGPFRALPNESNRTEPLAISPGGAPFTLLGKSGMGLHRLLIP